MMECRASPAHYSNTPLLQFAHSDVMLAMAENKHGSLLAQELAALPGVTVKIVEPLARYTSMKIGGPADYFIEVNDETALANVLARLQRGETG